MYIFFNSMTCEGKIKNLINKTIPGSISLIYTSLIFFLLSFGHLIGLSDPRFIYIVNLICVWSNHVFMAILRLFYLAQMLNIERAVSFVYKLCQVPLGLL